MTTPTIENAKEIVAALFLFGPRYESMKTTRQDFYNRLPEYDKEKCRLLVKRVTEA